MSDPIKPRLLVVDDNENIRNSLFRHYRREFEMVLVADVTAGLDQLSHSSFDAIVSDLEMIGRDGLEFYKVVCDEHPAMSGKFILHTGAPERARRIAKASRILPPTIVSKGDHIDVLKDAILTATAV